MVRWVHLESYADPTVAIEETLCHTDDRMLRRCARTVDAVRHVLQGTPADLDDVVVLDPSPDRQRRPDRR